MQSAWVKLNNPINGLNKHGKATKTLYKEGTYRIFRRQNTRIEIYKYLNKGEYYQIKGYIIEFLRAVAKEFQLDIDFLNSKYNTRHLGFLVIKALNNGDNFSLKEDFNPLAIISRDVFDYLVEYNTAKTQSILFRIINNENTDTFLPFKIKEGKVIISFWKGNNEKNGLPNIYLSINNLGETWLVIEEGGDNQDKILFLETLANLIGCERWKEKGIDYNSWVKRYNLETTKKEIRQFLENDKKRIDYLININKKASENIGDIDFLEADLFNKYLERALQKRNKNNQQSPEVTNLPSHFRIKNLSLKNIGHFRKVSLNEIDKRVICFIGENGIGKSTILRAIALGLIGVDQTSFVDTKQNKLKSLLRIEEEKDLLTLYAEKGTIELDYFYENEQLTNQISISNNHNNKLLDVRFSDTGGEFRLINTEVNGELNRLIIGFPQGQGHFDYKYEGTSSNLEKVPNANISDLLPLIYDTLDDRIDKFSEWLIDSYSSALQVGKGNWKATNRGRVIQKVFDLISELTNNTVTLRAVDHDSRPKKVWITTNEAPDGILLDLISQGFKKVFGWIGYFVMRLSQSNPNIDDFTKAEAIVFIDEIATYLHPKWQGKIMRLLVDNFENVQFIISTHSPLVINSLKKEEVAIIQIKMKNQQVQIQKLKENIYGTDVNTVLEDTMGTPVRPQEVIERLTELFQLIDKQELAVAKEKYRELSKRINPTDADLQRADMMMETWTILKPNQ